MAVLKSHRVGHSIGGAVALDLADLKKAGERVLAEARAESERIVREARADAARVRGKALDEAHTEGLAKGHAEGLLAGRAEGEAAARAEVEATYSEQLESITTHWTEALTQWEASRDALLREARRGTIRLALGIAGRVVRRVVQADPDVAAAQLEACLELLGKASGVIVSCAPDDRELLGRVLPTLLERLGTTADVTFSADAALGRGDVIVRVAEGGVDSSLSTQLDRLAEALLPGGGGAIP